MLSSVAISNWIHLTEEKVNTDDQSDSQIEEQYRSYQAIQLCCNYIKSVCVSSFSCGPHL